MYYSNYNFNDRRSTLMQNREIFSSFLVVIFYSIIITKFILYICRKIYVEKVRKFKIFYMFSFCQLISVRKVLKH